MKLDQLDDYWLTQSRTRKYLDSSEAGFLRMRKDPRINFPPPDDIRNGRPLWKWSTIRKWEQERAAKLAAARAAKTEGRSLQTVEA